MSAETYSLTGGTHEQTDTHEQTTNEEIRSLSAEAVLSKALTLASRASREKKEGQWNVSVLPLTKEGTPELLYVVHTDSERVVTVEVVR